MPPKVDPKSQRSVFADLAKQIADHQARIQIIAANWSETITEHLNATERKFLATIAKELEGFKFRPNAKETLVRLKKIVSVSIWFRIAYLMKMLRKDCTVAERKMSLKRPATGRESRKRDSFLLGQGFILDRQTM